ncbi:hypothetical protein GCM10022288_22360 [Gryllotalpicola kribbensis]|uniref:D-inositol 3-phosphate glycosyltransferase n=1 Tax=Gryllotalpicola kribbensis TaxID=993084 RepID=A0ABP8AWI2_9MICO
MTRLNVVHVVCTDAFAGVERYVRNSALWLSASGCRVTVVGGAEAALRPVLEDAGVAWLPGATPAQALRSLRGVRHADVINTHMTAADAVGAVAGGLLRAPVVSTRHFAAARGSSAAARVLGGGIRRRVAAQLAISDYVAGRIDGRSTTVRSGVQNAAAVTAPRERTVLVAQRLEPEKQTRLALEAWARLRAGAGDSGRDAWRLVIAGDGSQRGQLEQLARELGIAGEVDFLGHRSDMDELYRTAGALLATTPIEAFGLAVLEAMSHGLPVVAAAAGGHLETVGGVAGAALFAPGDADAAAGQLARLIGDPRERVRYGDALRERQRELFTAERQTEGTLRLFWAVVGSR